ncbi:MAG TPA: PH domain-containing protein [Myxococcota bacterium]|nr:PH domain-containing protein [Myxococcota bacterium]
MGSEFAARLSGRVRLTTVLGTVALLLECALMALLSFFTPQPVAAVFRTVAVLIALLFVGIFLVAVRGYRIERGVLRVERPFWSTTHSIAGLQSALRDPAALRWTALGFGNNGLFALNGWRKVAPYGWCRVLATDPANAVVLRTPQATYIVTPDRPDEFVQQAQLLAGP